MFHIGHLNILRRAKEQCEHLIVGVSTDELVREYKHKTPIIPYDERAEIVGAIKYVDEVLPQTAIDKYEAWNNLKFNVLFHGDDWKGTDLYLNLEKKFNSVGVDIVYLPHTSGVSSTSLAEKLHTLNK